MGKKKPNQPEQPTACNITPINIRQMEDEPRLPNIQSLSFVRVSAIVPKVIVADPLANAEDLAKLATTTSLVNRSQIIVFPELSLTSYSVSDLFLKEMIRLDIETALSNYLAATASLDSITIIGLPLYYNGRIFNAAAVCYGGEILGLVLKRYPPNYNNFYEGRQFASGLQIKDTEYTLINGRKVPVTSNTIFRVNFNNQEQFTFAVEICEDGWMPIAPSMEYVLNGATIIFNLSASNALVGKADYRRQLVRQRSADGVCAYVYVSAGPNESTDSTVFDGHVIIAENDTVLIESPNRFSFNPQILTTDIDVGLLESDRRLSNTFGLAMAQQQNSGKAGLLELNLLEKNLHTSNVLLRRVDRHPFVPQDKNKRDERCREIFNILVTATMKRIKTVKGRAKRFKVYLALSGGSDSTLALLVLVQVYKNLGLPLKDIVCVTMPGLGTSKRTKNNAIGLAKALKTSIRKISIKKMTNDHLRQIRHNTKTHPANCLVCQNSQARARTMIIMDLGFMIGTGDMSEGAIGWTTFNGDNSANYNPIIGVPKTLVKFVIGWTADTNLFGNEVSTILLDVLATPVSPELLPGQVTEDEIGPYELHDFFLHGFKRGSYDLRKIFFLALSSYHGEYDGETILKWEELFFRRFFINQFKRNSAPDGSKAGSVFLGSRADWRMSSDLTLGPWLAGVIAEIRREYIVLNQ